MRKILAFICMIIFCFSLVGCGGSQTPAEKETAKKISEIRKSDKSRPDKFAEVFEVLYGTPITERTSFDPLDKNSEFYKAEYKQERFLGATGETGKIGEHSVAIINFGSKGDPNAENKKLRVCVTAATVEEAIEMFPSVVKALDPKAPEQEIQELIDHLNEWGVKNGLFVGRLKGTFFRQNAGAQFILENK